MDRAKVFITVHLDINRATRRNVPPNRHGPRYPQFTNDMSKL